MERKAKVEIISSALGVVETRFLGIFFFLMLTLLFVQVVCRYYLHLPLAWVEELIRYLFIGVSYLGCAVAIKDRAHIEINILPAIIMAGTKSKEKTDRVLYFGDILLGIISTVFLGYLLYTMVQYMLETKAYEQVSVAMQIPMWSIVAIIVVSSALSLFHCICNLIMMIRNKTTITSKEEEELKNL
ncbi:TRAP transporter small permease [Clostridium aminobutyricum]|uniref:TRAP transporter small permease n=1 Tax=Clostridium aminobutyricum TaxID=33953 RepID=A0A939D8D9_CLOAM|nr:TRAP transporter small permease [Clostridium aminobutyricum]MBN7772985.1 TRAP transporter small permease [Clostridium aminobutyricum]